MKKNKFLLLVVPALIIGVGSACKFFPEENTTYGKSKIGIDATLQPAIEAELYMFEQTYKNAKFTATYAPELDIVKQFINDSFEIVVLARPLNQAENDYFKSRKIVPRVTTIAKDGIAIILNQANPDSLLSYEDVIKIFDGAATKWSQISKKNELGEINLLFDAPNSSTATYFLSLINKSQLPVNSFAAQNGNMEVIEKVSKNRSAIGVVGLAWLGELNNKEWNTLNKQVRIAYIRPKGSTKDEYYKADQMNLSDSLYPFIRPVNIIECTGGTTLGTGFASFCFNEQGQRIISKTGILPFTPPQRKIN
ncbi:MAG: PstS family phosphate ABC transporter substrate-binding protein, partial [Saprospiraceae bacterium]